MFYLGNVLLLVEDNIFSICIGFYIKYISNIDTGKVLGLEDLMRKVLKC